MKPQDGTLLPDNTLLSDVILSTHAEKIVRFAEPPINTVGDLRKMSDHELLRIQGCGRTALLEFRLLTGQYQPNKPSRTDQAIKQMWVREIKYGTYKGSFEDYRKEHNQ